MKPIAVAILNWNGRHLLQQFMPHVWAHSCALAAVYVIDNNSDDDSVIWLQKNYPEVKIIKNNENAGYAGGYNLGLKHVAEEIVVLLNSDIETTSNWLEPLLDLFVQDDKLAACQPKIKDLKNRDYFEYAGAAGGFIDWLCYPFCRGRILYHTERDEGQYNTTGQVFWATGAALVVRRSAFNYVGGLDESFFAHMEEIDLCWRFQTAGYRVMYCAESTVYHLGGGTLNESSPRKTYLNFRNNLVMMAKNLPTFSFLGKLIIRLVLDGVAGIKFLLTGQSAHTWQVVRAHFSFYKRLPYLLAERREHTPRPRIKTLPGTFKGTIIWQYFAKRNKKFSNLRKSQIV